MTWSIGSNIRLQFKKFFYLSSLISHLPSKKGFSLIELLVVVIIIGTLVGLSLPRFKGTFNNLKFDNFCQNLVSRMRYLKERASVEQNIYRLNFDLGSNIIRIEVKEEASGEFSDATGLLGRKITIPDGIEIEIDEYEIFFYPDASIDGFDIGISGYQNKATIYIKESIGRIELQKDEE